MAKISIEYNLRHASGIQKPLYIVIYFGRKQRLTISTKIYVNDQQFDKLTESVINHPESDLINMKLSQLRAQYQQYEIDAIKSGVEFTYEYFKQRLATINADKIVHSYMLKAIVRQTQLSMSSVQDHFKTQKKIKQLFPNLTFDHFTIKHVHEFDEWLRKNKYALSTIAKEHKNLKKYINLAELEGVHRYERQDHPYSFFRIKKAPTTRCFLSERELKKIEDVKLPESLTVYRDCFLFMCYTGLRISDFMRIEQNMLDEDLLIVKPKKTDKFGIEVRLPLMDLFGGKPYRIWEKYNFSFPKPKGFENVLNKSLKLIANYAHVKKHLSCHVARHSFLTFLAVKTGNVLKVMKLGGLRKMDTAMVYIHLADQDSREFVQGIEW